MIQRCFALGAILFGVSAAIASPLNDEKLQKYFESEVARIEAHCFAGIDSTEDWKQARPKLHRELREMLGLDPMPPKTELRAAVTGRVAREGIVVEKVHFQSAP